MKNKTTIIIPTYKPKKEIFDKLKKYLKENAKRIEIIEIEGINGLAKTYNEGIEKAKGDIIITLHQDCIPLEKNAIKKLIKPFKDKKVILTYSWVMEEDVRKKYYPSAPDGKFTAYRKSALQKVGLFDEKHFLAGGEDIDIWLKLKKIGKIEKVDTGLLHIHPNYRGNKTLEKRRQNGSINGALFRIWGTKNPKWLKALIICVFDPLHYGKEFWKAFSSGKQNYRRKE